MFRLFSSAAAIAMESSATESALALNFLPGLTAAVAGVAFHVCTQPYEIDLLVCPILGLFVAAGFLTFYVDVKYFFSTPAEAATNLAVFAVSFTLSLIVSTLMYRAFFHRLRKFPGPFAARLTRFYGVFYMSRNLQYHREVERLHKKHGDVVRTGPRELSVARASALPQITACRKTTFYNLSEASPDRQAMALTRDFEDHRRRRRPWEMALSLQALYKYDPEMQAIIGTFLDQLSAPERAGKPVDVSDWIAWLSYDIMGAVGFGRAFGNLDAAGEEHAAVRALRNVQKFVGYLKPVPWLSHLLNRIPGCNGPMRPYDAHCAQLVADKLAALQKPAADQPPADIITWIIKAFQEKSPAAPRTRAALVDDARVIVIAGADTSSGTLINALYYLATHPHVYAHLQAEVDAALPGGPSAFAYDRVKDLPLLEGVILETLRLQPPVPSGNPRLTPPEGLRIDDDLYLPGDVVVLMPQWVIQRDERYFERATEFVPERWVVGGEKAEMVKDRAAWFPFQVGMYHCVGKQMAMWEMRSVLARVALQFDIKLAPGEDGERYESEVKDTWTLTIPSLRMCFSERERVKA